MNPYQTTKRRNQSDKLADHPDLAARHRGILLVLLIPSNLALADAVGIACYHDAHVESELKPTFKLIVENFGWTGFAGCSVSMRFYLRLSMRSL